ncbi:MAG TPA: ATP-binding protein [Jatrophihabitantaceae bacterium]
MSAVRRSRVIAARLLSSNFSPTDGPLVREGLWRRVWPFVLAGLAARAMLWLPGSDVTDRTAVYVAAGCTLALVAVTVFTPWRRLPVWTQGLVPMAFLGVIALLREGTGGVGGYSVLVMLPVLWIALYGTLWQMVTTIFLAASVFVVPILALGGPTYPASGLGRILLWPITAAIVGGTTYRLVAAERARTALVSSVLSAATQQSIIATNPDGLITVFNTGAERMFGYSAKEMIGVSTPVVLHDQDEVAERAAELGVEPGFDVFSVRARQGEADTQEWTYVRRDGSRLQVSLSVTPIHDDTGELRGFIKIGTDVTERRASERLKDDFVALVSHELRTPLSSIIGYLEVIFDDDTGPLTPRQRQFLEVVDRNARRQLRLVSDLLFVSQVDAGRVRLDIDEVDLTALAKASIEAAQPRAKAAGVTLQLRADDATMLLGDADRLGQIFDNLLTNAIKFSPAGGQVDVRLSSTVDAVEVEVSDSGIGIAEVDQQRLFTRFFRAATATDRAIPGIGLGLTIVKAIVDAHRGTVSVTSVEGRGTTFTVSLPRSGAAGPTP